ncbi:MAG: hypothetical protein OEZ14_00435 [Acidimicrobiia bacterium]|nr:hypothetical protein [Acidimicrobiia bacterium]MDH5518974.1 hypothetical protein [Acidimicrobiia bacterium]
MADRPPIHARFDHIAGHVIDRPRAGVHQGSPIQSTPALGTV